MRFDNAYVKQTGSQKHLGLILDTQLIFEKHLKTVFVKVTKTIGLIQNFRDSLQRSSSLTLFKVFAIPHLDCGDIIYDQVYNNSFKNKK